MSTVLLYTLPSGWIGVTFTVSKFQNGRPSISACRAVSARWFGTLNPYAQVQWVGTAHAKLH